MQNQCQDNFSTTFTTYGEMQLYHEQLAKDSQWQRCKVSDLHVEPLDRKSPLFSDMSAFALGTSSEAVAIRQKTLTGHLCRRPDVSGARHRLQKPVGTRQDQRFCTSQT